MIETVILHVGPHKTGTTALQNALSANVDRLARHGILYPQSGRNGTSHAALAEALLLGDHSGLARLAREADGWRAVLVSCEHLSALDPAGLAALRDSFPKAEVRVAYALRRLVHLWPSHWAELVKHSQNLSFAGYLDRVTRREDQPFMAPILPLRQLDRLADTFGTSALHLSLYDLAQDQGHDQGPAFIDDLLGLGHIAPTFATQRANPSPSDLETGLVYLLNRHAGSRANHVTRQKARSVLLDQWRGDPPPPWHAPLKSAIDAADRIAFASSHPLVAREQEAVAARYAGLVPDGIDTYLQPDQRTVPDFDRLQLDPETAALLARSFDIVLAALRPDGVPQG